MAEPYVPPRTTGAPSFFFSFHYPPFSLTASLCLEVFRDRPLFEGGKSPIFVLRMAHYVSSFMFFGIYVCVIVISRQYEELKIEFYMKNETLRPKGQ